MPLAGLCRIDRKTDDVGLRQSPASLFNYRLDNGLIAQVLIAIMAKDTNTCCARQLEIRENRG